MRSVLVVSHTGAMWGAQLRLCEMAPRLLDRGFRLTLAGPSDGPLGDAWRQQGLPFLPFTLPEHVGLRDEGGGRPSPLAMAREVGAVGKSSVAVARAGRSADLLQSHSLTAHLEVALAGRLAGRPAVLDVHDIVRPGLGRRVLHLASRLATRTLANSRATAETVGGSQRRDVDVVHPGVDLERFRPGPPDPGVRAQLGGDADAPLVGVLGRVDPVKRLEVVIDAVAALVDAGLAIRLAVVGDAHRAPAGYLPRLRSYAQDRLGGRVQFTGPRSDVPAVLRALDVVVGAPRVEPFGRTIVEAQACGRPVIAPAEGGGAEIVDDGRTGLLVPPGDPDRLAEALGRLVRDPDCAVRMGEAGVANVGARFSLDAQADAVAAVYERALARRSPARPRLLGAKTSA
ncbi:MAG TPA: glycosyltransferase family 4 protein [Acidimicrobiia bacterium]|nr:glycosyltransferase family 4 protein [Acidimicrobiia bacterium]